jgi:hypothetical protein
MKSPTKIQFDAYGINFRGVVLVGIHTLRGHRTDLELAHPDSPFTMTVRVAAGTIIERA